METVLLFYAESTQNQGILKIRDYKQVLSDHVRIQPVTGIEVFKSAGNMVIELQVPSQQPGISKSWVRISRGTKQHARFFIPTETDLWSRVITAISLLPTTASTGNRWTFASEVHSSNSKAPLAVPISSVLATSFRLKSHLQQSQSLIMEDPKRQKPHNLLWTSGLNRQKLEVGKSDSKAKSHSPQHPRDAMLWNCEVEDAESIDDLITSESTRGKSIGDFENLDFKIASGRDRSLHPLDHERPMFFWRFVRIQAWTKQERQRKGTTSFTFSDRFAAPKIEGWWKW